MKKWLKWEFWPFWLFYTPVYFQYLWLSTKAQSFVFFSASNPGMKLGGFSAYSKCDILHKIPSAYIPKTILISESDKGQQKNKLNMPGINFPFIAKPDFGERGFGVSLINDQKDLQEYLTESKGNIIFQEFIDYPLELGVMYHRYPNAKKGKITSIVIKEFLTVFGDGTSTLLSLLEKGERTNYHLKTLKKNLRQDLNTILNKGEKIQVQNIGNHCLGTTFLNGNHLITEKLEKTFDKIALQTEGFYFGRFDVRVPTIKDLHEGKNIKIMELNGANSEPAHMYDPNTSLVDAYKAIFKHWNILFDISTANHKEGIKYDSFFYTLKEIKSYFRNR